MRYWRFISVVIIAILGIGTFYIHEAIAGNPFPKFVLEKKQGDEKELDGIVLDADYWKQNVGDQLQITADGSKYFRDYSYLERLPGIYETPFIKRLQKDYKSFMRGKYTDRSKFYEDEKVLAYINAKEISDLKPNSDYTLSVDLLDKASNERQSFQLTLPNNGYSYVDVIDMRVHNGEVIVFTQNFERDSGNTGINAYWINPTKQKITKEETIFSPGEKSDDKWSDVYLVNSNDAKDVKHQLIFQVDHYTASDEAEVYTGSPNTELMAYNVEKNELKKLDFPKEIDEVIGTVILHDGKLFFRNEPGDDFKIFIYDIEDHKMKNTYSMEIPSKGGEEETTWNIDHNKLYIYGLLTNDSAPILRVVDLLSEDILYEGKVVTSDPSSVQETENLNVYGINIER